MRLPIHGVLSLLILLVPVSCEPMALAQSATPFLPPLLPSSPPAATTDAGPPVFSLRAAFDEALLRSPRAASARAKLGLKRAGMAQALSLPNPSIVYFNDTAQKSFQLGVSIPIEPPWKLAFRILLARKQIGEGELQVSMTLWSLRCLVRSAYLDVVLAREQMETSQQLNDIAHKLLVIAQRRHQSGDVAGLDVTRATLASLQAEANLRQAQGLLLMHSQRLNVLTGRDHEQQFAVARLPTFKLRAEANELLPNLEKPMPDLKMLLSDAQSHRLDRQIVKQRIAATRAELKIACANILPNPQLNVGHSRSGNPPEGPSTTGYFIGVTQELPVGNFQQGSISRLRAQERHLQRELSAVGNLINEEVIVAYQKVRTVRERIKLYQTKVLASSSEVARLSQRAYEVGHTDLTTALSAQESTIAARSQYLDAVRQYQQSLTEMEQAVGMPQS